jgi:hypothetical protein
MRAEAKDRFFCIECLVQVVVGSEARIQSAAVTFQRQERLCTRCMYKREKGAKQAEKHIRESVRAWRDRTCPISGFWRFGVETHQSGRLKHWSSRRTGRIRQ